jgi:Asp-tRNA(Asn)/Glu-tRNA(Gln) amidotransferase A subunit family amidase
MMSEFIGDAPLQSTVAALRSGSLDLVAHVNALVDRVEALDGSVRALLPEPDRRARLVAEAEALLARYPDAANRPALFGAVVGVKDIFITDGFVTRLGSAIPVDLFSGPEATSVRRLREAGALVLGKTVSTEFAGYDPGATVNPHNVGHTPGGSSSGSAAAVAAGFAVLALGTQTVGSVIRPASFCGVVGFKPSLGRIPRDGVYIYSSSVDHVGTFTQDVAGAALAASVLCDGWSDEAVGDERPVLGVPEGPYLEQVDATVRAGFEGAVERLVDAGYEVRREAMLGDIEEVGLRHRAMVAAEFVEGHVEVHAQYGSMYRAGSAMSLDQGRLVTAEELAAGRASIPALRAAVEARMEETGIDALVCPSSVTVAPEGLGSTGNPAMNMPWTHSGMPAVTLPSGFSDAGLPLGTQVVGRFMSDERLLGWCGGMEFLAN